MKKILCLLNPASGKVAPQVDFLKKRLREIAQARGWDLTLIQTERPGHATEVVQGARGQSWDRIISCGGDGIINEVAGALVGSAQTFGLLPFGSGNGLARHLRIPLNLEAACAVIDAGASTTIDTGTADGHPFINVAGVGFDAEIGRQFNTLTKRGPLPYFKASFRTLWGYQSQHYALRNGEVATAGKALLVSVANGSQYGNNARIAPIASLRDGCLDLVHLPIPGPLTALTSVLRLFRGNLHKAPRVTYWQGDHFDLQLPAPAILHTDGEIHSCGKDVTFRIQPASLKICLPETVSPDRV